MFETSKSVARRLRDPFFRGQVYHGDGIDIGAGSDPLSRHAHKFTRIVRVRDWDRGDGDAETLPNIPKASFDFVHSSHCLEHLANPYKAVKRWLAITKSGGHVIITVPDFDLYERGFWPSRFNPDHKHAFTMQRRPNHGMHVIPISELADSVVQLASLVRCELLDANYRYDLPTTVDQTMFSDIEAAIEIVFRRQWHG